MVEITPIAAASIGAIAGSIGAFAVGEIRDWRRRRRERENLRVALYQEIVDNDILEFLMNGYFPPLGKSKAASQIFDGNTSKIGLLTNNEIKQVTKYYTRLNNLGYLLGMIDVDEGNGYEIETEEQQRAISISAGRVITPQLRVLLELSENSDRIQLPNVPPTEEQREFFGSIVDEEMEDGRTIFDSHEVDFSGPYLQIMEYFRNYDLDEKSAMERLFR